MENSEAINQEPSETGSMNNYRTPLSELWVCGSCKWYGTNEEQDVLGSRDGCCPQCGNEDLMRLDSIVEVMHVCGNEDEIDRLISERTEIKEYWESYASKNQDVEAPQELLALFQCLTQIFSGDSEKIS